MPDADPRETADALWAAVDAVKEPLRAELTEIMAVARGGTQIHPGPGLNKAVDIFLSFGALHGQAFQLLNAAERDARLAEDAVPVAAPPSPPPPAPFLTTTPDHELRQWLKLAEAAPLRSYLAECGDDAGEMASKLLGWAKEDGNLHDVLTLLESTALPKSA